MSTDFFSGMCNTYRKRQAQSIEKYQFATREQHRQRPRYSLKQSQQQHQQACGHPHSQCCCEQQQQHHPRNHHHQAQKQMGFLTHQPLQGSQQPLHHYHLPYQTYLRTASHNQSQQGQGASDLDRYRRQNYVLAERRRPEESLAESDEEQRLWLQQQQAQGGQRLPRLEKEQQSQPNTSFLSQRLFVPGEGRQPSGSLPTLSSASSYHQQGKRKECGQQCWQPPSSPLFSFPPLTSLEQQQQRQEQGSQGRYYWQPQSSSILPPQSYPSSDQRQQQRQEQDEQGRNRRQPRSSSLLIPRSLSPSDRQRQQDREQNQKAREQYHQHQSHRPKMRPSQPASMFQPPVGYPSAGPSRRGSYSQKALPLNQGVYPCPASTTCSHRFPTLRVRPRSPFAPSNPRS